MNVAQLFVERAADSRDEPAITQARRRRQRTLTFGQLDDWSAGGASALRRAGLRPGDRVLVLCPMSVDLYVALLAVLRAGLAATFVDPGAARPDLEHACAIASPKAMIAPVAGHLLSVTRPALRRVPRRLTIHPVPLMRCLTRSLMPALLDGRGHSADTSVTPRDDCDPALLTFTSGSTGNAKAAMRSHGFLLAQLAAIRQCITMQPGEVELATMPVFALASLAAGAHVVIADGDLRHPGRVDPDRLLRQIQRHRPVRCIASPALLERLADRCLHSGAVMDSFTHLYTGGAPAFPHVMRKLQRAAPRASIVAVYGSTEAEPIASLPLEQLTPADVEAMHRGRGLLAGTPEPMATVRVIVNRWGRPIQRMSAPQFEPQCLPPGQAGEIVVSGEHVLPGYLEGVGDEQTKFNVDGVAWHRTGDVGSFDEHGRLWLLGRADGCIEDARGRLYPLAVEAAASQFDGVARCAMVAHDGQRILLIEPRAAMAATSAPPPIAAPRATELVDHIMRRLAWAQLDRAIVVASIPVDRRHNAKVDYPALRRLAEKDGSAPAR